MGILNLVTQLLTYPPRNPLLFMISCNFIFIIALAYVLFTFLAMHATACFLDLYLHPTWELILKKAGRLLLPSALTCRCLLLLCTSTTEEDHYLIIYSAAGP